jgi:hypothetical protein
MCWVGTLQCLWLTPLEKSSTHVSTQFLETFSLANHLQVLEQDMFSLAFPTIPEESDRLLSITIK